MTIRIFDDFLGIPYLRGGSSREGADCWGLVPLVYRETRQIEIPLYNEGLQGRPCKDFLQDSMKKEVDRAWEKLDPIHAQFMDVVLLQTTELHVGIVDQSKRYMLTTSHTMCTSKLDEWGRGTRWDGKLLGVYRYVG